MPDPLSPATSQPPGRARRRNLIPFVIVGVLGLLAAGAAILAGVFQSPATADLVVHNAAGETVGAGTVTGAVTTTTLGRNTLHFTYHSPDRLTEYLTGPTTQPGRQSRTTHGPAAKQVLVLVEQLDQLNGFTARGSVFTAVTSLKQLVSPSQRKYVHGIFSATATVSTGYVVRVQEQLTGTVTQGGRSQRVNDHVDFRLSRVDGWTAT